MENENGGESLRQERISGFAELIPVVESLEGGDEDNQHFQAQMRLALETGDAERALRTIDSRIDLLETLIDMREGLVRRMHQQDLQKIRELRTKIEHE